MSPGEKRIREGRRTRETEPRLDDSAPGEQNAVERLILTERDDFPLEQSWDKSWKNAFEHVCSIDIQTLQSAWPPSYPYFAILKDRLYRGFQDTQTKQDTTQLLVPKSRREMLFQGRASGKGSNVEPFNDPIFFWQGIHENVHWWCAACRECQLVNPPDSTKAPLRPLPLMQVPFERIGMDLIRPLERLARGHRFALVLVDYATRYPKAVALRNISAKSVAEALFRMISRVGIPKGILTDQGTAFMSRTVRELYELLGIKSVRISVYHQQTNRCNDLNSLWKPWFESSFTKMPTIFPPSSSFMVASPIGFWMSCERRDLRRAKTNSACAGPENKTPHLGSAEELRFCYRPRTSRAGCTIGEPDYAILHREIKYLYYSPLLALNYSNFKGPLEVTRRVGDLNYEVIQADRSGARQIYHLNLLKKWGEVEPVMLAIAVSGEDDFGPEENTKNHSLTLAPGGDHLLPSQLTDVARLQAKFADVFSPLSGRTNLIQHHIEMEPGMVIRSRLCRLPAHKKKVVQSELEAMLEMGVVEESHSDWASPIVLLPKTDGSVRFCVDWEKNKLNLPHFCFSFFIYLEIIIKLHLWHF